MTQVEVNGAGGHDGVEGDAVFFGQNGYLVRADFVGDIAVGGGAVTADQDEIDFAPAHEVPGGVIGDEVMGDAPLFQFPTGEACALEPRPRFIHQYMNFLALLMGGKNDPQGRAPI